MRLKLNDAGLPLPVGLPRHVEAGAGFEPALSLAPLMMKLMMKLLLLPLRAVRPPGIEPGTVGLKARSSAS